MVYLSWRRVYKHLRITCILLLSKVAFCLLVFVWEQVSLCNSGWSRTHCRPRLLPSHRNPLATASWVLGLKAYSALFKSPISLWMFYLAVLFILEYEVLKVYNYFELFISPFYSVQFLLHEFWDPVTYDHMLFMFITVIYSCWLDLWPLILLCLR